MSQEIPNTLNNLDNTNNQLDLLGFLFSNKNNTHHNNEKILDQFFFHGNYADSESHPIGNLNLSVSEFAELKSFISKVKNNEKLEFFKLFLKENLISQQYYKTQIGRYGTLQIWCKHLIFKQLPGEHSEKINAIEKLPLPTRLENFLKEGLVQEDTQTQSPRP